MGWSFCHSWDRKSLIRHLLEEQGPTYKVIAHTCTGNNLWAVIERSGFNADDTPFSYRFIALYLMQNGGEEHGWGYKDMDESCGPNAKNCPLKYLELAPWTEEYHGRNGDYAKNWREEVKAYWRKRKEASSIAKKMKPGAEFKTASGLWFFHRDFSRIFVVALKKETGRPYRVRKTDIEFPIKSPVKNEDIPSEVNA